eukprot:756906-Hanusia_phi.AAC.1
MRESGGDNRRMWRWWRNSAGGSWGIGEEKGEQEEKKSSGRTRTRTRTCFKQDDAFLRILQLEISMLLTPLPSSTLPLPLPPVSTPLLSPPVLSLLVPLCFSPQLSSLHPSRLRAIPLTRGRRREQKKLLTVSRGQRKERGREGRDMGGGRERRRVEREEGKFRKRRGIRL